MTMVMEKIEAVPETLTQMVNRFAHKREDQAKWVYSLATSAARSEYEDGTAAITKKMADTVSLVPETAKDNPDDLEGLAFALEILVAVQEELETNFYRKISEAEQELQWTLTRLQTP